MCRIAGATIEFSPLSDPIVLRWLTAAGRGPNILIECAPSQIGAAVTQIMAVSPQPIHCCSLPGRLALPPAGRGTLLLSDVAALTRPQQIAVDDWLTAHVDRARVISLTAQNLVSLVDAGAFLERLYYRLNLVRVDAAPTP